MNIETVLKKHNLRVTDERKQIFSFFEKSHLLSASDLLKNLPKIGRASVFRTIKCFLDIGVIRRVNLGENGDLYELVEEGHKHHEHMKCKDCDEVLHFDSAEICSEIFSKAKEMGFSIDEHQISVLGTCNNCK